MGRGSGKIPFSIDVGCKFRAQEVLLLLSLSGDDTRQKKRESAAVAAAYVCLPGNQLLSGEYSPILCSTQKPEETERGSSLSDDEREIPGCNQGRRQQQQQQQRRVFLPLHFMGRRRRRLRRRRAAAGGGGAKGRRSSARRRLSRRRPPPVATLKRRSGYFSVFQDLMRLLFAQRVRIKGYAVERCTSGT